MKKVLMSKTPADLTHCSLCDAMSILVKHGDTPEFLTVSRIDQYAAYGIVANMNEERGTTISYDVDENLVDDEWKIEGDNFVFISPGA